jgi:hypothetical protein
VEGLSTGTTDHTTLKNWMVVADIVSGDPRRPVINDPVLKKVVGISGAEHDEFSLLTLPQQIFLHSLRVRHETSSGPFVVRGMLDECLSNYPHLFTDDQFARTVRQPLEIAGWLSSAKLGKGPQGGKSGTVTATSKLLSIPIERLLPDFEQAVPPDLRKRIRTPFNEILRDLWGADDHKGGLALELLALRMILDLQLAPMGFRVRSRDTAYAEVDLIAESRQLLFSRWTFQCKRTNSKVGLSEVAKEVGIAIYARAHVVVMVATKDFSEEAQKFARQITRVTSLQFVFVPGEVVKKYLAKGAPFLRQHFIDTAGTAMVEKRGQANWS